MGQRSQLRLISRFSCIFSVFSRYTNLCLETQVLSGASKIRVSVWFLLAQTYIRPFTLFAVYILYLDFVRLSMRPDLLD